MYQLEYPWLLAALPLPLAVWWLLPPYREETASVRLAFFGDVSRAAGLTPASGAVVLRTTWLQKIVAPACWILTVLALARPQFVEPPIEKVLPARDLLLALDLSQSMDTRDFHDPSGRLEPRAQERGGRALAVGAGDVDDRRQPLVRAAERDHQRLDPVQRQVDLARMQMEQALQYGA